jgi:hypothetical protein
VNPIFDLWGSWMAVTQSLWLLFIPIAAVIFIINAIRK